MTLADKLKETRERYGYSQAYVAEQLSISRQSVSKWETGATVPELNVIIRLSEIYGITIDELIKEDYCGKKDNLQEECNEEKQLLSMEIVFLLLLVLVSMFIPVLGVVMSFWTMFIVRKSQKIGVQHKYKTMFYILAVVCMVAAIVNTIINGQRIMEY